jgi:nickel-dependent lactate racemase
VVVAVSDALGPQALQASLGPVLAELRRAGAREADVTVVLGRGGEGPRTEAGAAKRVGKRIFERIKCLWADPDDFLRLGRTRAGTPVDVAAPLVESDRVVAIGVLDYHPFLGYTGGAETIVPRMAGRETAEAGRRMALEPGAEPGRLTGNPCRDDIEEAAAMLPLDFILDVIVDAAGRPVAAVAGHPVAAHRAGAGLLDERLAVEAIQAADIVVASPGGAPHDRDLASCLSGLARIRPLAAKGGVIILVGACPEGVGDPVLARELAKTDHAPSILELAAAGLKPGGLMAATLARTLMEAELVMIAEPALADGPLIKVFGDPGRALHEAMARFGEDETILVVPSVQGVLVRRRGAPEPKGA